MTPSSRHGRWMTHRQDVHCHGSEPALLLDRHPERRLNVVYKLKFCHPARDNIQTEAYKIPLYPNWTVLIS
ncbi:hypothetical protein BRADI_1g76298v3 [Brachypodium distachyon]|uniref:Uncharacterized protein n=1 Tax=Brachypodium distachyon TaxID=15368 RepID=A0A0Q3LKI5_BRADI|nr:hypothetical protein BRADI_1g76298v3 [Brachypodium distachyon]